MANLANDEKQMFALVGLQSFNGSFKLTQPLCELLGISAPRIQEGTSFNTNFNLQNLKQNLFHRMSQKGVERGSLDNSGRTCILG